MAVADATACSIFCVILLLSTTSSAHNITDILSSFKEYSEYNNLLTQTKVADEINNRQTITVLVLNNSVVASTLNSQPLDVLKTLLSIHVVLDYFDSTKLQNLTKGSVISTTLYQTSGVAAKRNGFVNITDGSKGEVLFASATEGSKPNSVFTKSVKAEPYNISVIEISAPIDAPGVLTPRPTTKGVNLTAALIDAGSKTFVDLIVKANVLQEYDGLKGKGLTVFAPRDDAWKIRGMPDWKKLSENEIRMVLRYHATANYFPMATLKGMKDGFMTLVGGDKYSIVPEASGDFVLLKTGVDSARVVNSIVDSAPVALFLIDNVLLPAELFGNSSTLPPAGSPVPLPSPSIPRTTPPYAQPGTAPAGQPVSAPPALTPSGSEVPSLSPPAPSGEVPAAGPISGPAAGPISGPAADDEVPTKKSGGSRGAASVVLSALVIGVAIMF